MDDHLVRGDAGPPSPLLAEEFRRLVRCPEFQRSIRVEARGGRGRFKLAMGEMRGGVGCLDHFCGTRQSRCRIALRFRFLPVAGAGDELCHMRFRREICRHGAGSSRRGVFPLDLQRFHSLAGAPPIVGHHGDRTGQAMHGMHAGHRADRTFVFQRRGFATEARAVLYGAWSMPSICISMAYFALPVDFSRTSSRCTGFPM